MPPPRAIVGLPPALPPCPTANAHRPDIAAVRPDNAPWQWDNRRAAVPVPLAHAAAVSRPAALAATSNRQAAARRAKARGAHPPPAAAWPPTVLGVRANPDCAPQQALRLYAQVQAAFRPRRLPPKIAATVAVAAIRPPVLRPFAAKVPPPRPPKRPTQILK